MIKLMGMVDYGSPFGKKPVKEAKVPNFFLQMEKVKKSIDTLAAQRKQAVVPYNKETDPKRKEQLKQVLIKLTNQIKGLEQEMINLRKEELRYIEDLDANAQLDVSVVEAKLTEETKYSIGSGYLGNGLTYWNREEEEHGDYKTIAHIDKKGNLTLIDKGLPSDIVKHLKMQADMIKNGGHPPAHF